MQIRITDRGFVVIRHQKFNEEGVMTRLVQESSVIGSYDDSGDNPGSSCLWIGQDHHLNREEVKELIDRLQYWLDNKRLQSFGEYPQE